MTRHKNGGSVVLIGLAKLALLLFIAWQIHQMIWHDPQSWT